MSPAEKDVVAESLAANWKNVCLPIWTIKKLNIKTTGNDAPVVELSGGNQQKVVIAKALTQKPKVVIFDEPTTGLDPITAKEIIELMKDIQKKYNTSSLIITHDVDCARVISNRMILLIDGINYADSIFKNVMNDIIYNHIMLNRNASKQAISSWTDWINSNPNFKGSIRMCLLTKVINSVNEGDNSIDFTDYQHHFQSNLNTDFKLVLITSSQSSSFKGDSDL